jgi:hypothetical protein
MLGFGSIGDYAICEWLESSPWYSTVNLAATFRRCLKKLGRR